MTDKTTPLKGDIVETALKLSGISGQSTPADADTIESAMNLLEMTMLTLESEGVRLGYVASVNPLENDPLEPSGIPDHALFPISAMVADAITVQIYGTINPALRNQADRLKKTLYSLESPTKRNHPFMPAGAGYNAGRHQPQYLPVDDPITVERDGNLDDLTLN